MSIRTASLPMWKPTFSAPNSRCRVPDRMCSPVCCCILSNRQSQSICWVTSAPGTAAGGQSVHLVPDHPVLFMDIGDGKAGAVRQGQGAPVGGLAAPLGVKDGAFKGDAAPPPGRGSAARMREDARVR